MGCCDKPIQPPPLGTPLTVREASLRDKLHILQMRANDLRTDIIRGPGKHCEECLDRFHSRIDHVSELFNHLLEDTYATLRRKKTSLLSGDADPGQPTQGGDEGGAVVLSKQ
jgi:hypothetical protein